MKNILDRGACVHYGDADGCTALRIAVENDTSEGDVRLLLRAGADIYRLGFLRGESPMDCIGSHEGIRRLMHRAADRRHCVWIAIVRKRAFVEWVQRGGRCIFENRIQAVWYHQIWYHIRRPGTGGYLQGVYRGKLTIGIPV